MEQKYDSRFGTVKLVRISRVPASKLSEVLEVVTNLNLLPEVCPCTDGFSVVTCHVPSSGFPILRSKLNEIGN